MRKGRDGGNGGGKMDENSGHYIIASSQPPEHRTPTAGTPHALANFLVIQSQIKDKKYSLFPNTPVQLTLDVTCLLSLKQFLHTFFSQCGASGGE